MLRTRTLALVACALGLLMGLGMLAQAAQQPPQGMRPRRQRPMSVEERLKRMTERLNLTEEQREKIRPLLQEEANQIKALREDKALSQEDRREKRRQINQATRKQIMQVLTPEQKEKMREMRENNRERRQERRGAPPQ